MTAPAWRAALTDVVIDEAEVAAATAVLCSGWLTVGPETRQLEDEFAAQLGVADAVAVSSGTAALHLALLASGIGPGHEVIMPSLSFVAGAAMTLLCGATPVFADIESLDAPTLSVDDAERLLTPRTRAIIPMHHSGRSADLDRLVPWARRHRLLVIEDAAHAPVVEGTLGMLGTVGDVGCFSGHATKNLTMGGEGGLVVSRDQAVLDRVRQLRSHAMARGDPGDAPGQDYDVVGLGLNYRPTELSAAIGRIQLARLPSDRVIRSELVARYREALASIEGLVVPFATHPGPSAHHLMTVVLPRDVDRHAVRAQLQHAGVQTSVHYPPTHQFSYYRSHVPTATRSLPHTEEAGRRIMTLPLHARLSPGDVDQVASALADAVSRGRSR